MKASTKSRIKKNVSTERCSKFLAKSTMVDSERVEVADSGIQALQEALALQPENAKLHSLIATIYQFRSLAHQTGWAQLADTASQRYHHIKRKALADAAKAKQATDGPDTKAKPKGDSATADEKIRKTE